MKLATVTIVCLAVLIAGCGDNSSTKTEPASSQAKAAEPARADTAVSGKDARLKPEMLVQFTVSAVACVTREGLQKAVMHGINGETTKLNAMMISPKNSHGECIMLDPKKRYKTLSVEYNVADSDLGLVEIVGEGNQSDHGAWAMTVGAIPAGRAN
ncbi:hypothetical protein ACI2T7_03485 [Ralstonia nicotianae]